MTAIGLRDLCALVRIGRVFRQIAYANHASTSSSRGHPHDRAAMQGDQGLIVAWCQGDRGFIRSTRSGA